MEYVVIFEKCGNNYGAYVPDLPGCAVVGATLEEVRTLIAEAIAFHIEGPYRQQERSFRSHQQNYQFRVLQKFRQH